MRFSCVVAAVASAIGCGDSAVLVTVDGDLSVPAQLDGLCLGVFDADASGAAFTRFYPLGGELGGLPQSLAVEPGAARSATVFARGYRDGLEVTRDRRELSFAEDVTLSLDRCRPGTAGPANRVASFDAPVGARAVASFGREGTVVVVAAQDVASVLRASGGELAEVPGAAPPPLAVVPLAALAFDADGDCDDDVVLLAPGAPPVLWRRDSGPVFAASGDAFTGVAPAAAAAAADVDGDGDIDLVIGQGSSITLLRNDGGGRFRADSAAIGATSANAVNTLAADDLNADGSPDVVVGQDGAVVFALLNDSSGTGFFTRNDATLPAVSLAVRGMAASDIDGDGFEDLLVVTANAQPRLYINRGDGRLEDRSFVFLPDTSPIDASGVAVADWDGDCIADVVIATAGSAPVAWRGADTTELVVDSVTGGLGDQLELADLDDDGELDLLMVGSTAGVVWLSRGAP